MARRAVWDETAPVFLRAAGHPLRWRLLAELAAGDRQVGELTAIVGEPQNLVSYHLGGLRRSGLVSGRRSDADGRDTYYRLDLGRCGRMLAATGAALHPGLRLAPPVTPVATDRPPRVLFLCSGNSARSQMAEALLRHRSAGAVHACSAGSDPRPVHPLAVEVMAEHGIDLSGARAKHLDTFAGEAFDVVVTVCDRLREACPDFPGQPRVVHWSTPDPAREQEGRPAFRRVAADLAERIAFLRHALAVPPGPVPDVVEAS